MSVLIDPPRWPAHGTVFGHLVSDRSLDELHAFAGRAGLPSQAFDHDHYDVPASRHDDLVALGAEAVPERELVRRLSDSGLRVRAREKTPTRAEATRAASVAWARLDLPRTLRDDLLASWSELHRHYHDVRHLAGCLGALERLGGADRVVELAAWFHDAVYRGVAGDDELASALLAQEMLAPLLPADDVAAVAGLVRMTAGHDPTDERGALLSDADLAVLGQVPGRYHVYVRDVRLDYEHVDDDDWRDGREEVLRSLLGRDRLFRTQRGRELWEDRARANLESELAALESGPLPNLYIPARR